MEFQKFSITAPYTIFKGLYLYVDVLLLYIAYFIFFRALKRQQGV